MPPMPSAVRGTRSVADDPRAPRMTFDADTDEAVDLTSQSIEQLLGVPGDESYQRTARLIAASLRGSGKSGLINSASQVRRGFIGVPLAARARHHRCIRMPIFVHG